MSTGQQLAIDEVGKLAGRILDEVERAVVGKRDALELVLLGLLADGHILIEDFPGLAKTLIARSFAQVASMEFRRIQFTPDLMPADVTGSSIFDQRISDFEFRPGPIFTNLLLADEINRAPPKTQAALLEAMQERQVTVEGKSHRLPDPFLVIATQNPYEHRDVFELPESQLDRFLFKLELDFADAQSEFEMLDLPHKGVAPDMLGEVRALLGVVGLDKARIELDRTEMPEEVARYIVALGRTTRELPNVELGVSSRGLIHLAGASKANARLNGREAVTVEDVREIAPNVLRHRIIVQDGTTPDEVLRKALELVPVPASRAYAFV